MRGMTRLAFIIVGLAGLVGDVEAAYVGDAAKNDTVCAGHPWRTLRRDLRAKLRGEPAVLPRRFRALGARREKLLVLRLIEFNDK